MSAFKGAQIEATKRLLAIPKKERKTYTKIFAEKARQKQAK